MKPKLTIPVSTQTVILGQIRKEMPKPSFAFRSVRQYSRKQRGGSAEVGVGSWANHVQPWSCRD